MGKSGLGRRNRCSSVSGPKLLLPGCGWLAWDNFLSKVRISLGLMESIELSVSASGNVESCLPFMFLVAGLSGVSLVNLEWLEV